MYALYGLIFLEVFVIQTIRFYLIMKPILNLSFKDYFKILFKAFIPLIFSIVFTSISYHYLTEDSYAMEILIYRAGMLILASFYFHLNGYLIKEFRKKYKKIKA